MELKPYPEYKESGLLWLDKIPKHWNITRTKNLFRLRTEKSGLNHDRELLSIYTHIGVKPRRLLEQKGNRASTTDNYWIVYKGDLIVNKLLTWMGAIGVSHYDGVTSPAYDILKSIQNCNSDYYHYLYRTKLYLKLFKGYSRGIMDMRLRLYFDKFGQIPSMALPKNEQDKIVNYLKAEEIKNNKFIRAKQKLIKLLQEQKQVIITQAVTRGINPKVKFKPSGVDWLGDIPEHWEPSRLKYVAKVQTGITLGKTYIGQHVEERPYLRVANVQTGRLNLRLVKTVAIPPLDIAGSELKPGDVLMTEGGDIDKLGRGCIWRGEIEGCLHQNHIFAVRADKSRLLPDYLVTLIASRYGRLYFQLTAKQTTNLASTNSTTLGEFPLMLPSINEQKQIIDAIVCKTQFLDAAIARTEREIELIREYQTRLISDVVTGKVDVRNIPIESTEEREDYGDIQEDEVLEEFQESVDLENTE